MAFYHFLLSVPIVVPTLIFINFSASWQDFMEPHLAWLNWASVFLQSISSVSPLRLLLELHFILVEELMQMGKLILCSLSKIQKKPFTKSETIRSHG